MSFRGTSTLTEALERRRRLESVLERLGVADRALIEEEFQNRESVGYASTQRESWNSSSC